MAITFIDLFAGLGGFHLAAAGLGLECVFACELDPALRELYRLNFGILPAGDVNAVRSSSVPAHDLLCAGFPCQPFSKAGDQRGLRDRARGGVLHKVVEILRVCRPEFVLLENVAHFVRHNDGGTYRRIRRAIERLGYAVDFAQLSPHQFGVPQIRERVYLVGRRGGLDGFAWPTPETSAAELSIRSVLDARPCDAMPLSRQVESCLNVWQEFLGSFPVGAKLPSFPIWGMEFGATYPYDAESLHHVALKRLRRFRGVFGDTLRYRRREEVVAHIPRYARGDGLVFPSWKQAFIRQNRELYAAHRQWLDCWIPLIRPFPPSLQKLEWNCQGETRDIWQYVIQFRASGVRIKRPTTAPSLVAMTTTQVPIIGWERRYMTVRECARLQSMDELAHFPPRIPAMTALGNAVNVKVARLVLSRLLALGNSRFRISRSARHNRRNRQRGVAP